MVAMSGAARAFFVAAAGAAAIVAAAPASAANKVEALAIGPGSGSTFFGNSSNSSGAINDLFTFTVNDGAISSQVGSISLGSDTRNALLDLVTLNGVVGSFIKETTAQGDRWVLSNRNIAAGDYEIRVTGNWGTKGGAYAGTVDFDANSGVPEPATWALMILGFGAVGGAMRRRQSVKARVAFA